MSINERHAHKEIILRTESMASLSKYSWTAIIKLKYVGCYIIQVLNIY